MAGSFVWTLVLTDIASGWTEYVPLLVRAAGVVVDAVDRLRGALPFPLRGIDTDNGSEFLNEVLIGFCKEHGIELTRSRPYRKNDQAWVEQKNGAVVRRLVGYGRLEGMPGAEALASLYSAARLFVNVFQPSFKLAEKTRVGARVHKRYHAPETPCARLLASDTVPAAMKDRLRALAGTLDPLGLLDEIRAVQHHLAGLAAGSTVHPMAQRDADLDGFLRSLALAWRAGEVRPTHQPRKRPPRHWRTRQDPFETTWPRVVEWLEAEPHRTAKELFDRLRREHPRMFLPGQLRTLQRRVKDWRRLAARRLVFADPIGASPRRCCVTEPRRRFERLGFRLSAIDPDPEGRDRVAAGRPACQRAARALRLRYGPAGDTPSVPRLRWQLWALRPGLDGASRPSTTPHGTRQTAGFRMARRDGNRLESALDGGDKPADLAPRGAHGVACAGTSGRRWRPTRGGGAAVLLAPDPHQRRPSGPEHAACRGVLRSRVNRRADSSGH